MNNTLTLTAKDARKEMHSILKGALQGIEDKTLESMNRDLFGDHNRTSDLGRGHSTIPVNSFEDVVEYCNIEKGSDTYKHLLELERLSIVNKSEIEAYCDIYEKEECDMTATQNEKMITVITDTDTEKQALRKQFADILTKELFVKGFTLRTASNRMGCSEKELKHVINGDICLAPHHIRRFKDLLDVKPDVLKTLTDLAEKCYERPEMSQDVVRYITSDVYILEILEKAAKKNIPASKWKEFEETVNNDRSDMWNHYKSSHI